MQEAAVTVAAGRLSNIMQQEEAWQLQHSADVIRVPKAGTSGKKLPIDISYKDLYMELGEISSQLREKRS